MYSVGKKPRVLKIQKQSADEIIKSFIIRNLFKLKKENEAFDDRKIRDIRNS